MYTCTSILWQEFITQDKVTLFLQLMDHSPYYKPTIIINDNIWAFELNIKFQPMKMMAKIYNTYHTNKTILTIQIRHLDFWSESLSFNLVFNASITSLDEEFESNLKKTPKKTIWKSSFISDIWYNKIRKVHTMASELCCTIQTYTIYKENNCQDITEILLKVASNTITLTLTKKINTQQLFSHKLFPFRLKIDWNKNS